MNLDYKGIKRAVIYCRVSSDEQKNNTSLSHQEQSIIAFCAKNNIAIDSIYKEDYSGKTFQRPEWKKMLAHVKKNKKYIDFLLFYDYTRFGRNTADGFFWHTKLMKEYDIQPQSITQYINYEVPEYVYQLSIYLSGPQVDNVWRSIKTKNGMISRMKDGQWVQGRYPVGYSKDHSNGVIIQNEDAELVLKAFKMIAEGYTLTEMQQRIKKLGLYRSVQSWSKTLVNPFYIGLISNSLMDEPVRAKNMKPIVPKTLFNKVQETLNSRWKPKSRTQIHYPMKGFCRCGDCDTQLSGYAVKKKQKASGGYLVKKSQVQYYICNNKHCRKNISLKKMHEDFKVFLNQYRIDPELIPVVRAQLRNIFKQLTYTTKSENQQIQKKLTEIKKKVKSLHSKFLDGHIHPDDYKEIKEDLQNERKELELMLHPEFTISNPNIMVEKSISYLLKIGDTWFNSSLEAKNKLQKVVFPDGVNYLKEKRAYRTPKVNAIIELISAHRSFKHKKSESENKLESADFTIGSP